MTIREVNMDEREFAWDLIHNERNTTNIVDLEPMGIDEAQRLLTEYEEPELDAELVAEIYNEGVAELQRHEREQRRIEEADAAMLEAAFERHEREQRRIKEADAAMWEAAYLWEKHLQHDAEEPRF